MKKVVLHVNSFLVGSTGNIMKSISTIAEDYEMGSYVAYPSSRTNNSIKLENSIKIGNILDRNIHLYRSYFSGYNGCYSVSSTNRFLEKIDEIGPDIIHLHNLHNCYINLKILFNYIKERDISIVWTLHDCWSFTGQCPHYTMVKCDKWKSGCFNCPSHKNYPAARVDRTKEMYTLKKLWFTGVEKLTIVTPSYWLKSQVEQSFLSEYPVKVINNGVDLSIFKPSESNFRQEYDLLDKTILLGVANPWSKKKGLDVFIELSSILNESYKIVLVGLTEEQKSNIPSNILSLPRTKSQSELAAVYSAADIFINPTYEDTFPTTNLEAMACGTPIITFNTGGSVEVINKYTGRIVVNNSIGELIKHIENLTLEGKEFYKIERVKEAKKYDQVIKFNEYIKLYNSIIVR